jgi:DHA1 family multidrug resistance protein-like MFS transporter
LYEEGDAMHAASRARQLGKRFILVDNVLVVAGFYFVFPIIGVHFVEQMGWAAAVVGLGLGLRQVSQQGLGLIGGSLSDRFGAKPLIVGGMLLRAAGYAAMAYAQSPAQLFVACILSGLGGSLFEPARGALMVKLTRPSERNRFISVMLTVEAVSGVLGALLGTFLLGFDFYWVAMGGSAVFVLGALANAVVLPRYRVAAPGTGALPAMRAPLRDRPFVALVLILSGYYVMQVQLMLMLPVLITQIAGTPRAVAWMHSMNAALALLLLYPLARLGERYFSEEQRLLTGIGVMTASLAAIALADPTLGVFGLVAAFFTGGLIAEPAREALVARYASVKARSSYIGLSKIGLAMGGLCGYVAGGYLLDHARAVGAPGLPWLILAVIGGLTGTALALLFWKGASRTRRLAR